VYCSLYVFFFFFQAEDGIRDGHVTGVQTCALPILSRDPETGRYQLRKGVDRGKDQTYFLFGLTQPQLARTLFPIGEMNKSEVREIGRASCRERVEIWGWERAL